MEKGTIASDFTYQSSPPELWLAYSGHSQIEVT